MRAYDFIFRDTKNASFRRWAIFWAMYIFLLFNYHVHYGFDKSEPFLTWHNFKYGVFNLLLWLPLSVCLVFVFTKILIPFFLKQKKYVLFSVGALLAIAGDFFLTWLFAGFYFGHMYPAEYENYEAISNLNTGIFFVVFENVFMINIPMCMLATGIKFGKFLYLQQIENTRLANEKRNNEMRIIKNRLQPAFLLLALDNVYKKLHAKHRDAAKMILLFSDLLNYALYDSPRQFVDLEKEIEMIRSLIEFEKAKVDNHFEFLLEIRGEPKNKTIVPTQMLHHLQSSLEYANARHQQIFFKIEIVISNDFISMALPQQGIQVDKNNPNLYSHEKTWRIGLHVAI